MKRICGRLLALALCAAALAARQDEEREERIEKAIEELESSDPQEREAAVQKLIELEADREVEGLRKSSDPEVRRRAETVIAVVGFIRRFGFADLYARDAGLVEDLAQAGKERWYDLIGRKLVRRPEVLTLEQRRRLADELMSDFRHYLKDIPWNVWPRRKAVHAHFWWVALRALEREEEFLRDLGRRVLGEVAATIAAETYGFLMSDLSRLLSSEDRTHRRSAVAALDMVLMYARPRKDVKLDGETVDAILRSLMRLMEDPAQTTRWDSVNVVVDLVKRPETRLKKETADDLTAALLDRMSDPDSGVRSYVAAAFRHTARHLDEKSRGRLIRTLMERMEDEEAPVRGCAAYTLGHLGKCFDAETADAVLRGLTAKAADREDEVRLSAYWAVEYTAREIAVAPGAKTVNALADALLGRLGEKDAWWRARAIGALGSLSRHAAPEKKRAIVERILPLAEDAEEWIQVESGTALAASTDALRSEDAPLVEKAVKNLDRMIRTGSLTSEPPLTDVRHALEEWLVRVKKDE